MPTGYTACVADGTVTDLKTFAMQCARGMGALIMMRDEPHDAPIPEAFEPDTSYYDTRLSAARTRLAELANMDAEAREKACEAYNRQVEANRADAVRRNTETLNRYNAMIAQVVEWQGAPEGLKEFMLSQLHQAREFDCDGDPTKYMPEPKGVEDWFKDECSEAAHQIEYHERHRAEEIERTAGRNAWLKKLHESIA